MFWSTIFSFIDNNNNEFELNVAQFVCNGMSAGVQFARWQTKQNGFN